MCEFVLGMVTIVWVLLAIASTSSAHHRAHHRSEFLVILVYNKNVWKHIKINLKGREIISTYKISTYTVY
jgi:hypothetical protein